MCCHLNVQLTVPHYVCPLSVWLSVLVVCALCEKQGGGGSVCTVGNAPVPQSASCLSGWLSTDNQSDKEHTAGYYELYIESAQITSQSGAYSGAHWGNQLYVQRAQTTSQTGAHWAKYTCTLYIHRTLENIWGWGLATDNQTGGTHSEAHTGALSTVHTEGTDN